MKLKEILAKILFCEVDSVDNVLLHMPVGMITVAIGLFSGWLALIFGYGFIKYQSAERRELRDKAYPEIQGWLWGMGILAIILLLGDVRWN